jgi:hypothetical protein
MNVHATTMIIAPVPTPLIAACHVLLVDIFHTSIAMLQPRMANSTTSSLLMVSPNHRQNRAQQRERQAQDCYLRDEKSLLD